MRDQAFSQPAFRQALPALLFLTALFFMNFMGRILLAPFLPDVERELSLSHAQAGGFFLVLSAGYCGSLLASGLLVRAVGHKGVIVLSSALLGAGLLAASGAPSPRLLQLGLLGAGAGGGLYFPSAFATVVSSVATRDVGKALAVHELAPNVSLILAPLLSGCLGGLLNWRQALAGGGVLALTLAAVYALWGGRSRPGAARPATRPAPVSHMTILRRPEFWLLGIMFALNMGASQGHYVMSPLYLHGERGFSTHDAGLLLALSRCAGLAAALCAGVAADRFGPRPVMLAALLGGAACTAGLSLTGTPLVAAFLLQPVATVLFFPALFAAVHQAFGEAGGRAISLIVPLGVLIGSGAGPTWLGHMGDRGSFALGFLILGSLLAGGGLAAATPRLAGIGRRAARLDSPERGA